MINAISNFNISGLQFFNFELGEELYPIYALAIVFLTTKGLGMLMRKLGLPQVVGMVIAGLLIGPAFFFARPGGFHGIVDTDLGETKRVLGVFAAIGSMFILFSSGLETDVQALKKSGTVATLIALAGVIVPLILGFIGAMFFMPGGIASSTAWTKDYVLNAIFVGSILTATSVGITVECLRELGKLNSKVGQIIVSSAIIDDVIGIIVLSIVTSLKGGGSENPVWWVIVKVVLFFVLIGGLCFGLRFGFKWLIKKYPNKRRTAVFAIAVCFLVSFVSEAVFGIAAITGAYMVGISLSGLKDGSGGDTTSILNKKVITVGYLLFSPVFFANIGINANFANFKPQILLFALVFVILGILGKVIGCGGVAKSCKYKWKDSGRIGFGMIARGEVALAVYGAGKILIASKGGVVTGIDPMIPTLFLILISSILCPIILKILFKKKQGAEDIRVLDEQELVHKDHIGEHGRDDDNELTASTNGDVNSSDVWDSDAISLAETFPQGDSPPDSK